MNKNISRCAGIWKFPSTPLKEFEKCIHYIQEATKMNAVVTSENYDEEELLQRLGNELKLHIIIKGVDATKTNGFLGE